MRFLAPVKPGDTVHATVTVTEVLTNGAKSSSKPSAASGMSMWSKAKRPSRSAPAANGKQRPRSTLSPKPESATPQRIVTPAEKREPWRMSDVWVWLHDAHPRRRRPQSADGDSHDNHHDHRRDGNLLQGLGRGQPVVFSHGWPLNGDASKTRCFISPAHGYRCHRTRPSRPWPVEPALERQRHGHLCRRSCATDRNA